ncbi:alpha/beta hydrolase [Phaeobacter sp. B1627]|uniref:alpha/beta hydrolase n=1 Tax=Phaeobacter sp. B1627 TaxID=2583809 RepID=UPI00111A2D45|nr:alpha/beta fold hydrolase [Phaeobacter sp. B1627]TNJ45515.1 alpha/beta fold hydrolase [Phaeobacter sp. B1627]
MRLHIFSAVTILFLAACADRDMMPIVPTALSVGTAQTVFATTTRAEEPDGTFGFQRSNDLRMMEMTVSIPPDHSPGELSYRHKNPDPTKNFTIADNTDIASIEDLRRRFAREQRENGWPLREVTIFVHGFNSTHPETAYRAAQIAHDVGLPGSLVMYSWPSRGRAFGYAYDLDSMLFARDGLEETIRRVKKAGADRIVLVAHSMGTGLSMEMLRQAEIRTPGWASRTMNGGVILMSPDLDVDLFESQIADLRTVPQPFAIMVSKKDRILNISGRLRGTSTGERLGNISSADRLKDWPVQVIDLTAFDSDAASGHFVAATSPSLIAVLRSAARVNRVFGPVDPSFLSQVLPVNQAVLADSGKLLLERRERSENR